MIRCENNWRMLQKIVKILNKNKYKWNFLKNASTSVESLCQISRLCLSATILCEQQTDRQMDSLSFLINIHLYSCQKCQ